MVGCEIEDCRVQAIGRCDDCGKAFCQSHQFAQATCRSCGVASLPLCGVCSVPTSSDARCQACGQVLCANEHGGETVITKADRLAGIVVRSWQERTCPSCSAENAAQD